MPYQLWGGQLKKALMFLVVLPAMLGASRPQEKPFELKKGDRVAFLGDAFFERALRHGYLETLITRRFKDATIHFRNLGWSGDTVFGHGRASFGTTEDGYRRLISDIGQLKCESDVRDRTLPRPTLVGVQGGRFRPGRPGASVRNRGSARIVGTVADRRRTIVFLSRSNFSVGSGY